MKKPSFPVAIVASEAPLRRKPSNYPEPYASMMKGRSKRVLGDQFGLQNFGVNLVVLAPGSRSSLRHAHDRQDEFIYLLSGSLVLVTDAGRTVLTPGMCAGFRAGSGDGHHLINESSGDATYIEMGDRTPGDSATYPDDDLQARQIEGQWQFFHKDGKPW